MQKFVLFLVLASILTSGILAAEDLIHVVGRGETIYSISRFYGVSAEDLMKANGITDPSRLQAGGRLTIPSAITGTTVSSAGAQVLVDYRVVRGDTLFGIARNNGITLQALLDMNRFSSNHVIKVDDIIKIPGQSATATVQGSPTVNVPTPPTGSASSTAGSPAAGILSLRWPVNAREISYMTGQMGVVVDGGYNESVRSLTQGRVISAGPWRKFGRVVIVEAAGGFFYMYGGCEILSVKVGDRITPGMELGKLGINAVSEKPQLLFMVFNGDTPIDPARAPRAGGNAET